MKEQITAKLNNISNLEDRLTLKDVLNDVFLNLYEHSETMYQQLENRVFAEMAGELDCYDVYTTAAPRQEVDPVHYFLRPMCLEDMTERQYDMANITETAISVNQYSLMKVFFCCDYRQLKPILNGSRIFSGTIITDKGLIDARFTLRQDTGYLEQITKLYRTFLNNNIPWKTVNHPYIFRFAAVMLKDCDRYPEGDETVKEIKVDFAEYGPHVRYDIVPLWNIETVQLKSTGVFPMPCQSKINFEHCISLKDVGVDDGYLAIYTDEDISYIRRTKDELVLVAPREQCIMWDVVKIINPAGKNEKQQYPLVSNARRRDFSDIMAGKSPRVIKTEAELRRLISSYDAAKYLSLERIAIIPRGQSGEQDSASYEMNFFITDEIRRADYQNKLMLYFTTTGSDNYLICDLMSFVVSEVQMYYPEYKCEGIIL